MEQEQKEQGRRRYTNEELLQMSSDEFVSVMESNYTVYIPEDLNLGNADELKHLSTVYIFCTNAYTYLLFLRQWTDGLKRQIKVKKDSSPEAKQKELDIIRKDNAVQAALDSIKNAKETLSRVATFYRMEIDSTNNDTVYFR